MDNQIIGEIISCDNLFIAPITEDSDTTYAAGTPEYLAPTAEIKYDPKVSVASSDYDGTTMFNYFAEGVGETTITISGLSEKIKAQLTGKSYDPTTGMIYDSGDLSNTPDYALGYRVEVGTGSYLYFWLLKGKFHLSATDAKTKGQKVDPISTELTFLPTRTIHKWNVPDPSDATGTAKIEIGQKRVIGDTSDSNFKNADTWFKTVQIPGPVVTISPLAISSSTPTNGAATIPDITDPTITFNNAVADFNGITLLKSDGTIVDTSMTLSSDNKTVTITPSASLVASTLYTIVLVDVTDIFGQKLPTQSIKFTTA